MSPRRKTSVFEDLLNIFVHLPWWIGLSCAAGLFLTGRHLAEGKPTEIAFFYTMGFNMLAVAALIGAIVSPFLRLNRKRLLDRQQSLETIRELSWREFEWLLGEAYRRQGYEVVENGGGGADGGVDLILHGKKGKTLVQCKRWKTRKVGVDKVRELYGVVCAEKVAAGILVTSGNFTADAIAFAARKPLQLVNGDELAVMIRDVQPNTATNPSPPEPEPIPVTESVPDCPTCGTPMELRTAKRGPNAGNQFYGCVNYPNCRGTRNL